MARGSLALLVVVTLVVQTGVVAAGQSVIGGPAIEVGLNSDHVSATDRTVLNLTLTNSGDIDQGGPAVHERRVTTARNVELAFEHHRIDDAIDVKTDTVTVGSLPEGARGPIQVPVEIGDLAPGRYRIPVEVSYDYTRAVDYGDAAAPDYHDFTRTVTREIAIVVEEEAAVELVPPTTTDVAAGDTSVVAFAVRNNGDIAASEGTVEISTPSPQLLLGSQQEPQRTTTVSFDDVAPGDAQTVPVVVGAGRQTPVGEYPLRAVLRYENENGVTRLSDTDTAVIPVGPELTPEVTELTSDLRAGDEGTVEGRLTLTGDRAVDGAVLEWTSENADVYPEARETTLGELAPGETVGFAFEADVTTEASPGPRTVTARLRYRNDEDRVRRSESLDLPVAIGEERDDFLVAAPDAELTAGSGATVALAVENNRAETVSDVEAKLYADDPISAPDDEGYVASLAPGDAENVTVRLAAAEGAVPGKTYPVSVDFTYETADGDRKISDTYRVPVTTRASGGSPLPAVAVAVLAGIAALVLWLKRDRLTRRLRR